MSIDLSLAYQWAINKCNDKNVGYSQNYRNEQTVNGKTYYDCSSFIWYALKNAGFDVVGAYNQALWGYEGNAVTTHYLAEWLFALGFIEINISDEWKPADILWRNGHTEIVHTGGIGKGITMGAHTDEYTFEQQVSINTSYSSNWTRCFRYEQEIVPSIPEWIYGNRYLSLTEMENNATIIYYELKTRGWSNNAIAGVLGNMQQESTINPAIWQNLNANNHNTGYGLVQWTPATNYIDWANSNNYDITNGYYQLQWVDEITVSFGQWIKTDEYNISFNEFKTSTNSVEWLTIAFLKNFERAGNEKLEERLSYADYWYNFISNLPNDGTIKPPPITPPIYPTYTTKKHHYKFVLFSKRKVGIRI